MEKELFDKLIAEIRTAITTYSTEEDIIKQYFEIGKLIIENQNKFPSREELRKNLSKVLGGGYGLSNLSDMRRLYKIYKDYPEQFELAKKIENWSIHRTLLKAENDIQLLFELLKYKTDYDKDNIKEPLSANSLEKILIERKGQKKLEKEGFKINIESVEIKNFKSIVDVKIEKPNPFTVFVGSNACGKSNIFSAIDMLFYSYYNSPRKSFDDKGGNRIFNFNLKNNDILISLNTGEKEKLRFDCHVLNETILTDNKPKEILKLDFSREEVKNPYSEKIVSNFQFLHIKESDKQPSEKILLEKDGSNYKNILHDKVFADNNARNLFVDILQEIVTDIKDVIIEKNIIDGKIELYITDKNYKNEKIPESLISDGTKNIIIILTAILQSKEPLLICIEEPENGLHPLFFERFVGFIRSICKRRGHYIWFTTHSPTLVRHLERKELIIVDKIDGQTVINKASDNKYNDLFTEDDLPLDDAWLTKLFEGGEA